MSFKTSLKSVKGILSMFWKMTKEDYSIMDHKFIKIASAVVGFAIAALFWLFFIRKILPF
jgi:hypothetical protein